jgi:dTDP-4-dehydrorhamnose reductase
MTLKKTKILIVGIDSMIAQNLIRNPILNNFDIYGTTRRVWNYKNNKNLHYLDLTSDKINFPQGSFDFAVICAGETNIKNCQDFYDDAKKINVDNTIHLISNLISNGTFILFISSNAVFDGSKPFCNPTDLTNPINNYGKFKLEVENYLANQKAPSSILRLTKVVAPNFGILAEWRESLANNIAINAYTDLLISPIELSETSEAIISIINFKSTGVFHLGGKIEISYYEFAIDQFKNVFGVSALIKPATSSLKYQGKYNSLSTYLP